MVDTQQKMQLKELCMGTEAQRAETPTCVTDVIPSCLPPPAYEHNPEVALLAWVMWIAYMYNVLDIEGRAPVQAAFLQALHAAKALDSQHTGQDDTARRDTDGLSSGDWPMRPCSLRWLNPAHTRRLKVCVLRLGDARFLRSLPHGPLTVRRHTTTLARDAQGRFDGRHWTLRFAGMTVTLRNLKGCRYLTFLLQHPGEHVHVLDLLALTDAQPVPQLDGLVGASSAQLAAQGLRATCGLGAKSTIDATACAAYRQRLRDLREELEEAQRYNDLARATALRVEMDFLASELAHDYGSRTAARNSDATTQKARKAVSNRIRVAIAKLRSGHPVLWRHLCAAIHTGRCCSYQPTPPIQWTWEEH